MKNKTEKPKKTNGVAWLIIILIAIFWVNSDKDKEEISSSSNESNIVTTTNEDKWVDSYNQIESEDMFKVGDVIYILEEEEYVPAMEILSIAENIELESGYMSKKAMQVKTYGEPEDIFWKDIEQTLKTSLSEYGLKYFTKGKKYNP